MSVKHRYIPDTQTSCQVAWVTLYFVYWELTIAIRAARPYLYARFGYQCNYVENGTIQIGFDARKTVQAKRFTGTTKLWYFTRTLPKPTKINKRTGTILERIKRYNLVASAQKRYRTCTLYLQTRSPWKFVDYGISSAPAFEISIRIEPSLEL